MKKKFWNWVRNEDTGSRTLVLNGQISDETWFGDEVTPGLFVMNFKAAKGTSRYGSIRRAGMCLLRHRSTTC